MIKKANFTAVLLISILQLYAQPFLGQREIHNFTKQQYKAGTQNWSIRQDQQGRMYFANSEGILTYDGTYFKLYPLPNKTIVWSVELGKDNRIYAGGQDELGYFVPDKTGNLSYVSLKNLIDESDQKFADIWNIVSYENDIFFRSTTKLFKYHNNSISVYQPWTSWIFLGLHQGRLIVHDEGKGILIYNSGKWESLIDKSALPREFYITSITPLGSSSLITTAKNGLYILKGNQLTPFILSGYPIDIRQHFTSSVRIDDDNYLIGTYNNGFYHIRASGAIVEHFSKEEGLQNSNIKYLFCDKNQNIWLGLSNGIDFMPYNSAVKQINPGVFNDGGGYAITSFQNKLYFGLSNGIYSTPIEDLTDYSYIKNEVHKLAEGQTWQLFPVNGQLLAGKEEGAFILKDGRFNAIETSTGYWTFGLMGDSNKPVIAAGNYLGVQFFSMENGVFKTMGSVPNLVTSSRFLAYQPEKHIVWVSHPYRGVYKIKEADNSFKLYTQQNGLPSTLNNHVYRIRGQIVIATEKGIYEYDEGTDRFIQSAYYKPIFNNNSIRYLKEDTDGNIWFVQEKQMGVLDFSGGKPNLIYLPEMNGRILSGFEHIYPINKNNIFIGSEKGFYHINYEKYKKNIHRPEVYISLIKVKSETEKMLYGGYFTGADTQTKLDYAYNSIHFEYSSPLFEQQSSIEYSYFLKGFEKSWSDWSGKTEKDYTNLPAGSYIFQVRARNNLNNESLITSYSFYIQPPWYASYWAYAVYFIFFNFLFYLIYKRQEKIIQKKQEKKLIAQKEEHEEEQRKLAYLHQRELEQSEKQLIQVKNEKLESEIEFKNAELAATAMNLVQKKELLLKIKDELNKINQLSNSGKNTLETSEIKKILRSLTEEEKLNDEWQQFSVHFNHVHSDFLVTLKEKFPDLKPHELKLCAYLRLNLSSKEIAQLMSISLRGVEISRYRLRKKLQLSSEENLFQFLFNLEAAKRNQKEN